MVTDEAALLIGRFLMLSSELERPVNECLKPFSFETTITTSMGKESFDFKCKRLRHYLLILDDLGLWKGPDLKWVLQELQHFERDFLPIRHQRNYLAHATFEDGFIITTRPKNGSNSTNSPVSLDELRTQIEKVDELRERAEEFFPRILPFLPKKKAPEGALVRDH